MDPSSESRKYFALLYRYLWLIVLVAGVAGGAAYLVRSRQQPNYQAEVLISVGNPVEISNPSRDLLQTGEILAQSYVTLIRRHDFLVPIIETLDLPTEPEVLRNQISARVISSTTYIAITVSDSNPQLSSDIANAIAEALAATSGGDLTPEETNTLALLNSSIEVLEIETADFLQRRNEIDEQLGTSLGIEFDLLLEERNRVTDQYLSASETLARLLENRLQLSTRINAIDIIDRARPPSSPSGISAIIIGAAGAVSGALIAVTGLLFLEFLNNTIRTPGEASHLLGAPVLGVVAYSRKIGPTGSKYLITRSSPRSSVLESYRTIQTNLLYASSREEVNGQVFIIASGLSGEGRTVSAVNLSAMAAESGLRVLLIDADFQDPQLHHVFGLDNSRGLIKILDAISTHLKTAENLPSDDLIRLLEAHIQDTSIPNLRVIPSGLDGSQLTTQILGFDTLRQCLDFIISSHAFDMIVFDTAPSLLIADSYVLAATTKANVILVVEAGQTKRSRAVKTKEQFLHVGGKISGIIVNKARTPDD